MTQDERKGMTPGRFDRSKLGAQELAFPRGEYAAREAKLKKLLQREKIDLLWLTTPDAVAWLHGYVVSWYKANAPMRYPQLYGTSVPANADGLLHFDNPSEEAILARNSVVPETRFFNSREPDEVLPFIVAELKAKGWLKPGTRIGMEAWSYLPNHAIQQMLEKAFRAAGAEIVDASKVTREARRVKSAAEHQKIREAVAVCDIGHDTIVREMRPGMTELELFGLVTAAMRRATLFQVLGIVLVENGLALAALSLPGEPSLAIEIGVAVDLLLVALVAGVFHERIFAEFGAGDTAALRSLRDS